MQYPGKIITIFMHVFCLSESLHVCMYIIKTFKEWNSFKIALVSVVLVVVKLKQCNSVKRQLVPENMLTKIVHL